jgi:hypothetical protein
MNERAGKTYKSPRRKLVRFFEKSRDQWRAKCLLILGVRLSELLRTDLVLGHEDVEPIALFPVRSSNGEVVFQQLEQTIDQTGLPREILADQGSDLKAGIERSCHQHPHACSIYDRQT